MTLLNQKSLFPLTEKPKKEVAMRSIDNTTIKDNWKKIAIFLCIILALWQSSAHFGRSIKSSAVGDHGNFESWCPLADPNAMKASTDNLAPSKDFNLDLSREKQIQRLSAAVKCPTESFDDNGDVDEDPRWNTFDGLHDTLKNLFPLIHDHAKLEKVNRYGLVYTVQGTSQELKPLLLTAHQDVVPASSISKWTYPPFEPHYDGQYLWGRGSSDCKNNLIGIMSVVESLLSQDWKPRRSVVLAFGFDEETGGVRGAAKIAEVLENAWGRDGFALILDEGGMGLTTVGDYVYARPAVAEKGYMDANLILETSGGHSSRPPAHSGIGIIAEMVVALEQNPYTPVLTKENPLRGFLECQARYTPGQLEPWLRRSLQRDDDGTEIGKKLADERGPQIRFSMQTSQAVDIIRGGDKVNALPETVSATVNYRIAPHESLDFVKSKISDLVEPIARKHNVKVEGFGGTRSGERQNAASDNEEAGPSFGTLYLYNLQDLSPSPISPTDLQNPVWHIFSGTIRQVFEDTETLKGKKVVPVGDIMQGNTDTIYYWNLTKNIYRFSPAREDTRFGVHTIDEHIDMTAHLEGMRLYYGESRVLSSFQYLRTPAYYWPNLLLIGRAETIRNFDAADI